MSSRNPAIDAYTACLQSTSENTVAMIDPADAQMCWLQQRISMYANSIAQHECPIAFLIHHVYHFVKEEVLKAVNPGNGHLALIGGITINVPEKYSTQFLPLLFEMHREGQVPVDCLGAFDCPVASGAA